MKKHPNKFKERSFRMNTPIKMKAKEIIRVCMDCPRPTRENPTGNIMGCVDANGGMTLTCSEHCNCPEDCEIILDRNNRDVTTGICNEHMQIRMEDLRRRRNHVK